MCELVSIIVPFYNNEHYISDCIRSILCQTYANFELICVSDGSIDNSELIVKEYQSKDSRIKLIRKQNGGVSTARNEGILAASGKYICFVDSDDTIDPSFLEELFKAIKQNNCMMAICGFKKIYKNIQTDESSLAQYKKVIDSNESLHALVASKQRTAFSVVWNKLYLKSLFINNLFFEDMIFEDECMMTRILSQCNRVAVVGSCLYNYYERGDSLSNNKSLKDNLDAIYAYLDRYHYFAKTGNKDLNNHVLKSINGALVQVINNHIYLEYSDNSYYIQALELIKKNDLLRYIKLMMKLRHTAE